MATSTSSNFCELWHLLAARTVRLPGSKRRHVGRSLNRALLRCTEKDVSTDGLSLLQNLQKWCRKKDLAIHRLALHAGIRDISTHAVMSHSPGTSLRSPQHPSLTLMSDVRKSPSSREDASYSRSTPLHLSLVNSSARNSRATYLHVSSFALRTAFSGFLMPDAWCSAHRSIHQFPS